MTAILAGYKPIIQESDKPKPLPLHRCKECTLIRCYFEGSTCTECEENGQRDVYSGQG